MEQIACEVLVIGSGAAGLRAAIAAREKSSQVLVISKERPGKGTCTVISGGVLASPQDGALPDDHARRTLESGRGINQLELVSILAQESPRRLGELIDWGMKGEFHRGYLFAKGHPPTWGAEIVRCLLARNKTLGTSFINGLVVRILRAPHGAAGVIAYSAISGEWLAINAKAVILATGGAGALYLRHDNPRRMLGDGYQLALEAGAVLQDMEFVQFYPFGLAEPGFPPFLIPPRIADLGRVVNGRSENILDKYGIEERPAGERARDRLSQALFTEIHRKGEVVWLDLRPLSEDDWRIDPFSASTRKILGERYGAMHRPVRVAPMAHHFMGGVYIDSYGATTVPGLFAAGEVTGGLHGANRMGGNALTETLVFGTRAGNSAAIWAQDNTAKRETLLSGAEEFKGKSPTTAAGSEHAVQLIDKLRKILWEEGGIIRNKEGLTRALKTTKEILAESSGLSFGDNARQAQRRLELRFGVEIATLILQGALRREESRGAHFREDFPHQDDEHWRGHLQVHRTPNGKHVWAFQPNRDD